MYLGVIRNALALLSAYGGIKAFIKSPFVHIAIIMALICIRSAKSGEIEKITVSILPNLLGFSIGAYAIIFGVLGERIIRIMALKEEDEKYSLLTQLSASFGYFVLIQSITLIFSVFTTIFDASDFQFLVTSPSLETKHIWFIVNFVRNFLLFYSMLLFISTTLEIFRISRFRELE